MPGSPWRPYGTMGAVKLSLTEAPDTAWHEAAETPGVSTRARHS